MADRRLRLGVALPHGFIGGSTERLRGFVIGAEGLGLDHLDVFDHVLGAEHADRTPPLTGPYDEHDPFREPMVLFGYLAAVTSSLELCTAVLVLPQRQTALVAKQAIEVDLLSGGRLRMGVGVGWNHIEYRSLNEEFSNRGRRLDDQLAVLRSLWDEPLVAHHSEFHHIDRAGLAPRPQRRIPLWLGGYTRAAARRAARFGDGFIFSDVAGAERQDAELRAALLVEGRDPDGFGRDVVVHLDDDLERWRRDLERCLALGATHVTMAVHRLSPRSTDGLLEAIATAGESAGDVGHS